MAFDYAAMQTMSLNLITEFGRQIEIYKTKSDYDPVTRKQGILFYDFTNAQAVTLPSSESFSRNMEKTFGEGLVLSEVEFYLVAHKGLSFDPSAGDYFRVGDKVFDVVATRPLNPAGLTLIHWVAVSRGARLDLTNAIDEKTFFEMVDKLHNIVNEQLPEIVPE